MKTMTLLKTAALILASSSIIGLAACQESSVQSAEFDPAFIQIGQDIVKTQCTACHSVDSSKDSPRPDAPSLSTVLSLYNSEALADDFREHLHVGHPDMPDYDFTVKETEGLLAYLSSIQETD